VIRAITHSRFFRVLCLMEQRIWPYFLGVTVWGLVLAYCFNMVMAFVFKDVLDAALVGDSSLLFRGVLLALATFVLGMPIGSLGRYALSRATCRTITVVRTRLFSHIARLPMPQIDERHSGDLISRSTNDVETLWRMLLQTMSGFAHALGQGIVGIAVIFALDWRLGLVALAIGLASFAASTRFARVLRMRSEGLQSSMATMTERLSDLLSGLAVTRMFQLEEEIHGRFSEASESAAQQAIAHARSQALFEVTQELLNWFQTFGTLALGLYLHSRGVLLVGAVWAVVHLQGNASYLFNYIGQFLTGIQRGLAGGSRVLDVLALPVETVRDHDAERDAMPSSGGVGVSLRGVCFAYEPSDGVPVLDEVTLEAHPGEMIALVGPSGSGKSTLLKLLLGLYPVGGGELRIGSRVLTADTLSGLRRMTAYVPQDAYLFSGSIEENIAHGRIGASHEEITAAARAANAHAFILDQPDGYETRVGERGARLSGGQRQRIAIARALLRNAPLLLLDEATSALDSESERLVQDALDRLIQGRTTVAIAHRLSTIERADRIFVLDQGRVVEQGCHAELLAANGLYRRLYDLQFATDPSADCLTIERTDKAAAR